MRYKCTDTPGPVGSQCQGQLIEGELIMPQLSLCCSLIAGLLCMSLISNSSVWPGSAALLLSCHSLSLCMNACVCEASDAPSPRLCVCSHGQQGVNPLLALLLHSGSLGGIIVLHLSLPGFILIGSTPDLPIKKEKKHRRTLASQPPIQSPAVAQPRSTIQKWYGDSDRCDTGGRGGASPRGATPEPPPPVAFQPALLSTLSHDTIRDAPHLRQPAPPLFLRRDSLTCLRWTCRATEQHLNQCPRLPICPLSC